MNFTKFLRTPFPQNTSGRLLLTLNLFTYKIWFGQWFFYFSVHDDRQRNNIYLQRWSTYGFTGTTIKHCSIPGFWKKALYFTGMTKVSSEKYSFIWQLHVVWGLNFVRTVWSPIINWFAQAALSYIALRIKWVFAIVEPLMYLRLVAFLFGIVWRYSEGAVL